MRRFTALIMDLRASRKYSLKNRNEIQTYIYKVIETLNEAFAKALEKNVSFSAGDELQGLFSSTGAAYLYYRLFSMLIAPVKIRAGLGVGEWDVVIRDAGTTAQDGSAYHKARAAIKATKDSLGYSVLLESGAENDEIANSLLYATTLLINKQSSYQNHIMLLSELLYPITIDNALDINKMGEIAELINLRSVSDVLNHNSNKSPKKIFLNGEMIKVRPTSVSIYNDTFITDGKVRGLPLHLSEIMGISRQSLDKTIAAANIYEARNLAIATLKYIKRMED